MKKFFLPILILIVFVCYMGVSKEKNEVKGRVLNVDNTQLIVAGLSKLGEQKLTVELLGGENKGKEIEVHNFISGSLEYDEVYKSGDKILVGLYESGEELRGKALSLYRLDSILLLASIFALILIIYAGDIGIKSIISFFASFLVIWYILIPSLKTDIDIFSLTIGTLILLSGIIIFLVAGFTKKGVSAFLGTLSGFGVTTILTIFLGGIFGLDGMNQPFAQSILLTTNLNVDLLKIFYITIALGASGAAMDVAMDMAATIEEIKVNAPEITRKKLIISGFNVGRMVVGTMTTTLLLAYSGGYLTLLMLFIERDVSLLAILNMKMMTSEIVKILIGSISLVTVAPLTSIISSYIYTLSLKEEKIIEKISKKLKLG